MDLNNGKETKQHLRAPLPGAPAKRAYVAPQMQEFLEPVTVFGSNCVPPECFNGSPAGEEF